jgi:F-type H+-transporting ATPase subunit alpha
LRSVPVVKVKEYEQAYLETLRSKHAQVLATLKEGKLTDEVLDTLNTVAAQTAKQYE